MWALCFYCGLSILSMGCMLGAFSAGAFAGLLGWHAAAIGFLLMGLFTPVRVETEALARKAMPFLLTATLGAFEAYQLAPFTSSPIVLWHLAVVLAFVYLAHRGLTLSYCQIYIFPLIVAGFLVAGFSTIRAHPDPRIDVLNTQQAAAGALVHLANPYKATIENIYPLGSPFIVDALIKDGMTTYGFAYPPLVAIAGLPGYIVAGDVRYSHLFAIAISACLIVFGRPTWMSLIAGILVMVNPVSLKVIEFAWTEPVTMLFFSLSLFAWFRFPVAVPYLFGLFVSSKQHLAIALVFVPLLVGWDWKRIFNFTLKALAVCCVVNLPFYLWNPHAFILSTTALIWGAGIRTDLLGFYGYFYLKGFPALPVWLPFLFLPLGAWIGLRKAPSTPAGLAAATTNLFLLFFALAKQAAPNYYFMTMSMLCCTLAFAMPADSDHS